MKKHEIVVKKEHAARRCEVCHKEDRYDSETQICSRCAEYQQINLNIQPLQDRTKLQKQEFFRRLNYSYQRNLETAKRLNQQDNQIYITKVGVFLISLLSLPLLETYWVFLTIPLLVFSAFFTWKKENSIALGIFHGILLSYGFLVFCVLLTATSYLGFFFVILFLALMFFTRMINSAKQI